ncbi:ParB N-terminal domain-containing protein [Rubellimicrobium roseum]|uniref:Uncharacterized protein n=1 Tax=Rubellimicrobium roseum TaxID=687525 RepID=A0A5C4N6K2_9RHOB|nr:ParB N-terminal domain-containing protein [Rubellimicrobium roseum]TNC61993.1 hypothetical protein FHG71_20615 [Rubellimicrobium roseum]
MTIHTTLAAGEIRHDHDFIFRASATDRHHVRTLQTILARRTKVEPLLVWRETGEDGPTGRFVLLDGRHRLAAYVNLKRTQSVPVAIFEGSRAEAIEAALQANAMAKLPLTASERNNAAWRLVWDYSQELSIARTARAAGVSVRLVSMMRARAKTMKETNQEWSGSWAKDRRGPDEAQGAHMNMTDAQRRREIKELAKTLREAAGMWPKRDRELFADALAEAFGRYHQEAAEYLYGQGEEDFYDEPVGKPDVEPEPSVKELEDVNPDF